VGQLFSHLAVSTNTYHGFTLLEALSGIAQAGFRFVELACVKGWTNHFDIDEAPQGLDRLQEALRFFSLQVVSLSAHSDLASSEGVAYLEKALWVAHELGAQVVNTGTVERRETKDALLDNLSFLAREAERNQVKIGLEIHGGFLKDGEVARELMEAIRSPWVGINYDTGNVIFYGNKRPEQDVKLCLPWIVHMHLKDKRGGYKVWDFPPLGEGEIDFSQVLSPLLPEKTDLPLSVEIEFQGRFDHPKEVVDQAVRRSWEHLLVLEKRLFS